MDSTNYTRKKLIKILKINELMQKLTYNVLAQSKNLCNPFSNSLIWNQFDLNGIIYGALF